MRIHVLYRPRSEHGTQVEQYLREFSSRCSAKVELIDIDTREGSAEAELYDIVGYPAVLAINDDGGLLNSWQGEQLPLMDELASYVML
jgi:hypothetical protein